MKLKATLLIFSVFHCCMLSAQYYQKENNIWAFGDYAGIDFNGGSPKTIQTAMRSEGGSASVCDADGALLFYCNSDTIWNRNNKPMPHGYNISSAHWPNNTCQNTAIVPMVGTPDKYYVFTVSHTDSNSYNGECSLYYSMVDMGGDNGLGDVTTQKIFLTSGIVPKMTVIKGVECTIWLIVVSNTEFIAYPITPTGIGIPISSLLTATAIPMNYNNGVMKASPDRTKLLVCNSEASVTSRGIEIFDFDTVSGSVANPFILTQGQGFYSGCFSPDNSKLYCMNDSLFQFNLSLATHTDIINSKTGIHYQTNGHDMKIGPDGKIYVGDQNYTTGSFTLDCILNPNLPGASCNYTTLFPLLPGTHFRVGFPLDYVRSPTTTGRFVHDTSICAYGTDVPLSVPTGAASYVWSTGSINNSITVNAPGKYWVTSYYDCHYARVDTYHVAKQYLHFTLGPDTNTCANPPYYLSPNIRNAEYLWSDGSTKSTFKAPDSGTYWARINLDGCYYADTIHIGRAHCNCWLKLPSGFSPNNDGKNDRLHAIIEPGCPYDFFIMNIFNRWGQCVFTTKDVNKGWDGILNGVPCEVGTYMYEVQIRLSNGKIVFEKGDVQLLK